MHICDMIIIKRERIFFTLQLNYYALSSTKNFNNNNYQEA